MEILGFNVRIRMRIQAREMDICLDDRGSVRGCDDLKEGKSMFDVSRVWLEILYLGTHGGECLTEDHLSTKNI